MNGIPFLVDKNIKSVYLFKRRQFFCFFLPGGHVKKVLITGGTVFVSKFTAKYFVEKGYQVYVLNRGSKPQVEGVTFIRGDRHDIKGMLEGLSFDAVIDITAYKEADIRDFVGSIPKFETYIMISSSAVYSDKAFLPYKEEAELSENKIWTWYGTDKIAAERALLEMVPEAYILRPPYLYGQMNNVYREAFVFDCAMADRKFYLPRDGEMKLQFLHVRDLCRIIEKIIEERPNDHILNVGNKTSVTVKQWVEACYKVAGKNAEFENVYQDIMQREYFSFFDYDYSLDVTKQHTLVKEDIDLIEGLKECFDWYKDNQDEVIKKPYIQYIDENLSH